MELANALGQGDRGTETRNRSGMASELAGPVVDTKIGFAEGVSGASSNEPLSPGLESRPLGSGRGQAARGLSKGRDNLLSAPSAMGSIANPLGDGSGREGNGLNARRGNEDWIRDLEASSDRQASGRAQTGRRDGLSLEGAESGSLYGPLKSSAIPVPNEEGQGRGNVPSEGSPDVSSLADRVQSHLEPVIVAASHRISGWPKRTEVQPWPWNGGKEDWNVVHWIAPCRRWCF